MPQIIRIAGVSGSGKTTLIQQILAECRGRNISTACLKHSHHHLQLPEKDSTRLFQASSDGSMVIGGNAISITLPLMNKTPQEWSCFLFPETDLVLVEGWREHPLPTVLLTQNIVPEWKIPERTIASVGEKMIFDIPSYPDAKTLIPFLFQYLEQDELIKNQ